MNTYVLKYEYHSKYFTGVNIMATIVIKRAYSSKHHSVNYNVWLSDEYVGELYNGSTLKISADIGIHRLTFSRTTHFSSNVDNIFDVVINEADETVELECKFELNEFTIGYADNALHIPTFTENLQQSDSVNDEYSNDFYEYDDYIENVEKNGDFMKKDYSKFGAKIKLYSTILTVIYFISILLAGIAVLTLVDTWSYYINSVILFAVIFAFVMAVLLGLMFFYFTYGFGEFLENYATEQENLLHDFDKTLKTRLKESKEEKEK